jgi:hypothetical protein
MRKLFLMLAFALVGTFAFANTEIDNVEPKENLKTETLVNGDSIVYTIIVDEFDICTVTVTVTSADGRSFSATASDPNGDCSAAALDAELDARAAAAVII